MLSIRDAVAVGVVLFLVASLVMRAKRPKTPTWAIMAFSSFVVVTTGLVPIDDVGVVVNMDVVLFLIGMFSIVSLAESSGLLARIFWSFVSLFKTTHALVYGLALLLGLLSALAVNDTVALLEVPIAYMASKVVGIDSEATFLLLAFSVTIGSVATPMGNPQNVLIAVESGMEAPLVQFAKYLLAPTVINLLVTAH